MTLLFALSACTISRPSPVPREQASFVRLQSLPFAEIELPGHSRTTDAPITDKIVLRAFTPSLKSGRIAWKTPIPIRPRGMFFYKPEPFMRLLGADDKEIPYDINDVGSPPLEWIHDRDTLWVFGATPPKPGELTLQYPLAAERERALNRQWAGDGKISDEAFVWSTIQDDWDSRQGLLLPAPGTIAWDVTVPAAGELSFTSGIVPPEIKEQSASDGAQITVEVSSSDGATKVVGSFSASPDSFVPRRVDLSAFANQQVRLRIRSEPMGTNLFDYVFLAEPSVASREQDPVRVVMVFIDTLRPDHMSLYGYERDTTAPIDVLAESSAVFSEAYSVAPWTLPSARTIVTGRQPEWYAGADKLPDILARKGWATAFFAGNVYLSVNFDMHLGWDLHRVGGLFPAAEETTDDALQWLAEHEGRNALMQVHYMDAHLPYHEPEKKYRSMYAGDAIERLGEEFHLPDVRAAKIGNEPDAQQYVKDRYDNNVRYISDQVARLVNTLDDNDLLLLYSDHGEEFWDHGGFEHGHTLFQELVHVPLVIRGRGIKGQKLDTPVSLIDLAPTVLDLVGELVPKEMEGRSLAPLMRGEPGEAQTFEERGLAFGRPLYGLEQWGVLHEDHKWLVQEGREALYDLSTDPGEKGNLLKESPLDLGAPYRDVLAQVLGREVVVGYRLSPTTYRSANPPRKGLWALCSVPGGFRLAWPGADPLVTSWATVNKVDDIKEIEKKLAQYQITNHPLAADAGAVEMCWHPGRWGSREVYLIPNRPLEEVGLQMICSGYLGNAEEGKRGTIKIVDGREPVLGKVRTPLNKLKWDERQLLWQFGISPAPVDVVPLIARDGVSDSMLGALGYVLPDASQAEGEAIGALAPCEPARVPLAQLPDVPNGG